MIKSMTGFASLAREDETAAVGVTIRAVNHRFLDLQLRLPSPLADMEARLRALVQKRLARGRAPPASPPAQPRFFAMIIRWTWFVPS